MDATLIAICFTTNFLVLYGRTVNKADKTQVFLRGTSINLAILATPVHCRRLPKFKIPTNPVVRYPRKRLDASRRHTLPSSGKFYVFLESLSAKTTR